MKSKPYKSYIEPTSPYSGTGDMDRMVDVMKALSAATGNAVGKLDSNTVTAVFAGGSGPLTRDERERIVDVVQAVSAATGKPVGELVGNTVAEIYASGRGPITAEDRARVDSLRLNRSPPGQALVDNANKADTPVNDRAKAPDRARVLRTTPSP